MNKYVHVNVFVKTFLLSERYLLVLHVHVLMRDEKEERKKQATNKQGKATQHTQGSHFS